MNQIKGSYILVLLSKTNKKIPIGKKKILELKCGIYVYTGSAFGPGGLRGRLAYHFRTGAKLHWHIDYLKKECEIIKVWISYKKTNQEHHWASVFLDNKSSSIPLPGFGSSDCKCPTHLYYFKKCPSDDYFKTRLQTKTWRQ